eukprot:UN10827
MFDCTYPTARELLGLENPYDFFQYAVTVLSVHDYTWS